MSYHGLIPERVYLYTCASFKKNKQKEYSNKFGDFQYKCIPAKAYPYEILMIKENEYCYWIASAEKALCDKLYDLKPVNNKKELIELLFEDLRIDEGRFNELDKNIIRELCPLYHSNNLKLLMKVMRLNR